MELVFKDYVKYFPEIMHFHFRDEQLLIIILTRLPGQFHTSAVNPSLYHILPYPLVLMVPHI